MKIGINSRIYQNKNTGIPYYIEGLYKNLLEIDKRNKYVFFQTLQNKTIGRTKIINLLNNSPGAFLFDNFLINRLISKEKINIFHGPAHILPFFKKKNVKYILTIHDLSFLLFKKNESTLFNIYYKYALLKSLNNADVIIADSKNTKKDIKRYYHIADNKIKVIYLGVNDIYFSPKKTKKIINHKYFFSLTTHPKRKNVYRILEVFTDNKNLSDYKYVIAGLIENKQLLLLKNKIKELKLDNRVILFGYATELQLKNLYENAEFFIYPSYYEGFGLPILEAMACRCHVITSNNSSLIEITPNKQWLINPYNSQDISAKMNKLLYLSQKERSELLNNNYNFAKKFTWQKTAEKYLKIFNNL